MVQNPPTIIYRPIVYHVVNADPALPPETTVAYIPDLLQTAQAASTFRSMQPTVHPLADANPANPANPANRPHSANPAARSNGATAVNLSLGYATNFPQIASAAVAPREELRSIGLHIPPARGGEDKPEGLGLLLEKPFGRAMAAEVAKAKKGNDRKANQARETNAEAPYTAAHAQAGQKATAATLRMFLKRWQVSPLVRCSISSYADVSIGRGLPKEPQCLCPLSSTPCLTKPRT
jgi:hypothetical protein